MLIKLQTQEKGCFGKENKGHTVKAELISNAEKAISRERRKLQLCSIRQKNGLQKNFLLALLVPELRPYLSVDKNARNSGTKQATVV